MNALKEKGVFGSLTCFDFNRSSVISGGTLGEIVFFPQSQENPEQAWDGRASYRNGGGIEVEL